MNKKHSDVLATMDEFTTNYEAGLYQAPWDVYIGNDADGYQVKYSNEENKALAEAEPVMINSILARIAALENNEQFCYPEEYESLVANGSGWVTNLDGTRTEVTYDPTVTYNLYEDDGPVEEVTPEDDSTDGEETVE